MGTDIDISVVMPTYGRRDVLRRTLDAYEHQGPETVRFEIVVVDDGSTDGTAEMLAEIRPRRYTLRFESQENAGPAAARNRALDRTSGALVLITGDDIEPTPDLLDRHLAAHTRHADPRVAVLGLTVWPPGEPRTATMRHIDGPGAQQFSYGNFTAGAEYDFRHLYTSNISLHRRLLAAEPGPFSTVFPAAAFEDAELGHRLAFHGLRIVYHPEAVGYHHHPYGARGFYRRQFRCGQMAAVLLDQHPELARWTGVRALEWRRLDCLALPASERRRLRRAAEDPVEGFDAWRDRALALAEHYDPIDPPGIDHLLHVLFDLGYNEGLATALWGDAGRRVVASLLAERLPEVVGDLDRRLADANVPNGLADARILAEIRPFLASSAISV